MIDNDKQVAYGLVLRYEDLRPKLAAFHFNLAERLKREGDLPAGPVSLALAGEMLRATLRVVSRQAGASSVRQLKPRRGDSYRRLHGMMEEAAAALDDFHRTYYLTLDEESYWSVDPGTER